MKTNSSVETFGSRIDLIIDSLGGPGKAAEKIGTNYTTLKRWRADESEPSLSTLVKIAEVAGVSLDWLMKGVMDATGDPVAPHGEAYTCDKPDDEYAYIPAYEIELSSNAQFRPGVDDSSKHMAYGRQWLKAREFDPFHLLSLFTKGNSMAPTIPESAAILVNTQRTKALDGRVYVIQIEDRLYVKRTQWLINGGLRLISDNKFYDPLDITKDDLQAESVVILGQVVHVSYDLPD